MEPELSTAFTLLLIGMITVFIVLLLVVLTGNLLITLTNKYSPSATLIKVSPSTPNRQQLAAITAAVEVFTNGAGRIEKIEKPQK